MKNSPIQFLIFSTVVLFSSIANAIDFESNHSSKHSHRKANVSSSLFTSYESNGADFISSIGLATTLIQGDNLGVQLNTSLAAAEVLATDGYLEEYSAWQVGVKAGYFGKFSIFVEAGYDLSEALFNDSREDGHSSVVISSDGATIYEEHHHYDDNDVDIYLGAGVGAKLGKLSIDGLVRWRAIDGDYWKAESEVFSGVQISLNF